MSAIPNFFISCVDMHATFSEQGSLNINFNATFVWWIRALKAMISNVKVLEETGKKLKYCQLIYSRRGRVERVFISFATRLKSLQKELHQLAIAAESYLEVRLSLYTFKAYY